MATERLLERAALTIEDLTRQLAELHQTIAVLRSDSAAIDLPVAVATPTEDVLVAWLASLDPVELDRHVQAAIAEAMVESTMAARRIRQEAIARTQVFVDAVALEANRLIELVAGARGSVTAMNTLSYDLSQWQGGFQAVFRRMLEQLMLPWATQVSQVATLLTRMNDGRLPDVGQGWAPGVAGPSAGPGSAPHDDGGSLRSTPVWG